MKATRSISRRSFLGAISGGAAAAGAILALSGCATLGYSDRDPGDPIGGGYGRGRRGGGRDRGRGCSDNDRGRGADPAGRGRCR